MGKGSSYALASRRNRFLETQLPNTTSEKQNSHHRAVDSSTSSPDKDRASLVNILTPDPSPLKSLHLEEGTWPPPPQLKQVPLESYHQITNGMPSPMDECDHLMNIDPKPTNDASILKRKLDGSYEELSFPCKKIAGSPVEKLNVPEASMTTMTPTKTAPTQPKLTKAERDALKMEKAKEREVERQKKEQEKQKREEERLKKVMYLRKFVLILKQAERDESKKKKDAEKEEARLEKEKKEREKEEQRRKREEEIEKKNKVTSYPCILLMTGSIATK
jgi:hypothetical protein